MSLNSVGYKGLIRKMWAMFISGHVNFAINLIILHVNISRCRFYLKLKSF